MKKSEMWFQLVLARASCIGTSIKDDTRLADFCLKQFEERFGPAYDPETTKQLPSNNGTAQ
jgi:hypothetical protein